MTDSRSLELIELTKVIQHYEGEIERKTGGQFNLMSILGVGHLEVKTHSPILGDLLSPAGSHGQGATFLRSFTEQLGLGGFDPESATLRLEYYTGVKTEDSGGRIDLFLQDNSGAQIIIENKIYAQEQENQMLRYGKDFPDAHLIYLTLNGDEPTSIGELVPAKLRSIAYKTDILEWLETCRKEAVNVPIVRESISQYINLIKELTQQNTSDRMSQKITEAALHDVTSMRAYFSLVKAETELKERIVSGLITKMRELARIKEVEFLEPTGPLDVKYGNFAFSRATFEKRGFRIRFEMEFGGFRGFAFGFFDEGKMAEDDRNHLREAFEDKLGRARQSGYWPAWIFWEPYRDWSPEVFEAIQFGSFLNDFERLLTQLIQIADEFCSS